MAPKSIKIVSVIDEMEVEVGRCHPGQARILRKHGMAKWEKDRLILNSIPSTTSGQLYGEIVKRAHEAMFPQYPPIVRLPFSPRQTWKDELPEIDPNGELMAYGPQNPYRNEERAQPSEHTCESLAEWAAQIKKRKAEGHVLVGCDEPLRLMVGFVDDTDNSCFFLSLRKIKSSGDFDTVGITKQEFGTEEGRRRILGQESMLTNGSCEIDWQQFFSEDTLEELWVQEVEETIGAAYHKGEHQRIDLFGEGTPSKG